MSIATEIQRLQEAKADIKAAIEEKGVEVGNGLIDGYADKVDAVYDKGVSDGKKSEYDEFWDKFQDNGNRTIYMRAFSRWGDVEMLSPKYKVVATSNSSAMFNGSKIKNIDKNKFDLSQATYSPTSTSSATCCICEYCNYLEVFPDINLQAGYYAYAFNDCFRLHTIEILRVTKDCIFATAFRSCEALKDITIEGEIGFSFDLHWSPLLTKKSINSIVTHLSDTATGQTVTFKKAALKSAFGVEITSDTDIPTDNEFYTLRWSKPNWTFGYSN